MPEKGRTDPVTRSGHDRIVAMITDKLPPDFRCLLIGGGSLMEAGLRHIVTTKDEDVVLLVVRGKTFQVADVPDVERLIRELGGTPSVRKDQTSVSCELGTTEGTFFVEFVRGRRGGHGYFVSRAVLEMTAALSRQEGKKLVPPLEALAFLKAWAAVDKGKLVSSGRDGRGYHAGRERAFKDDVLRIRAQLLDVERREPDLAVFGRLLESCSAQRASAVRNVLREAGLIR